MKKLTVIAFYKFVDLPDFESLREPLKKFCLEHNIRGSILLAKEGINSTMSGTNENIYSFLEFLKKDKRFEDLEYKESYAINEHPFRRMKVLLKKEIVNLGMPEINPNNKVGTYLDSEEWNRVISDPEVILIDTRNDFEFQVGTFKNAINPKTNSFNEFPEYVEKNLDPEKDKKVAMFCTGGIRCEKATSFMLEKGFKEVYHLKGGILKYLEEMQEEESLWEGECFVFDNRVGIKHQLEIGEYQLCHSCGYPNSPEERKSEKYEEGVFCPHCFDEIDEEKLASRRERAKQVALARQRNKIHIGQIFTSKSKKAKV